MPCLQDQGAMAGAAAYSRCTTLRGSATASERPTNEPGRVSSSGLASSLPSRRIGIDRLLGNVGRTLEVESIPVRVHERCDPETVPYKRTRWVESSCPRIVIHRDCVRTHEADGSAQAQRPGRPTARPPVLPVLLEHDSHAAELEPTPAGSAIGFPAPRDRESQPLDVEGQRRTDVLHVEERHRLLNIGNVGGPPLHRDVEECPAVGGHVLPPAETVVLRLY